MAKPVTLSTTDASLLSAALLAFRKVVERQVRVESDATIRELRSRQLAEVDSLTAKIRNQALEI